MAGSYADGRGVAGIANSEAAKDRLEAHLSHVQSLWQMQKQGPSHLRPNLDSVVGLTDDEGSEAAVAAGHAQSTPQRRASCPGLLYRAAALVATAPAAVSKSAEVETTAVGLVTERVASNLSQRRVQPPQNLPENKQKKDNASCNMWVQRLQNAASMRLQQHGVAVKRVEDGGKSDRCGTKPLRSQALRASCARWVHESGVLTLQMHGLSPWLGVNKLLEMLDGIGLMGGCNYIHIPRSIEDGAGAGYAFLNMISVEAAACLVESYQGCPLPAASENGKQPVTFTAARRQGYTACLQHMRKSMRARNPILHPFATSEDGGTVIMAPPEVLAALQGCGGSAGGGSSGHGQERAARGRGMTI
mmetsp:Transcript_58183/g.138538  ORF Transcript_58183/g.138538 Transcript_58183/m.138538 type:complete len:360 (-) Transcript_58183:384-1463(-)|eukprot:CAMPEP_0178373638 /NCGR_PEP_ID=MMETSP0689_2-20121128/1963_1 /TAXON_ID=160604 /ORGANISM="Amphidinium massartii, Strain CS-259" /LENGTH=359 /DNA_ID=CAMNT_0019993581 /DNA_START=25 /DNA_END=1104 /DNA_ORIENTATION=-